MQDSKRKESKKRTYSSIELAENERYAEELLAKKVKLTPEVDSLYSLSTYAQDVIQKKQEGTLDSMSGHSLGTSEEGHLLKKSSESLSMNEADKGTSSSEVSISSLTVEARFEELEERVDNELTTADDPPHILELETAEDDIQKKREGTPDSITDHSLGTSEEEHSLKKSSESLTVNEADRGTSSSDVSISSLTVEASFEELERRVDNELMSDHSLGTCEEEHLLKKSSESLSVIEADKGTSSSDVSVSSLTVEASFEELEERVDNELTTADDPPHILELETAEDDIQKKREGTPDSITDHSLGTSEEEHSLKKSTESLTVNEADRGTSSSDVSISSLTVEASFEELERRVDNELMSDHSLGTCEEEHLLKKSSESLSVNEADKVTSSSDVSVSSLTVEASFEELEERVDNELTTADDPPHILELETAEDDIQKKQEGTPDSITDHSLDTSEEEHLLKKSSESLSVNEADKGTSSSDVSVSSLTVEASFEELEERVDNDLTSADDPPHILELETAEDELRLMNNGSSYDDSPPVLKIETDVDELPMVDSVNRSSLDDSVSSLMEIISAEEIISMSADSVSQLGEISAFCLPK